MRVGLIGPLPPLRGGISHYNASLLETLRENNHIVTAVSFKQLYPAVFFPGTSERDNDSLGTEEKEEILKAWLPTTWKKVVRKLKYDNIEIMILQHWHPFFAPAYRYIIKQLQPTISCRIIAHNVLPHEKAIAGKCLNRMLFRSANLIVVGASSEAEDLMRLSPGSKHEIVAHPIYDRFTPYVKNLSQKEAKQKLGYKESDILLVHVGLVRKYKGLDILLSAFSKISEPNIKLLIAGEFYDDSEPYIAQAASSPNSNNITINNSYLSESDMAIHLKAADLVVLPYKQATQSGIAMAALAVGTPVIASKVGALTDVIGEGIFGFTVEPENPQALADAILRYTKKIHTNTEITRERIMMEAKERFSWQHLVNVITRVET